jgi:hypothetical protein
MKIQIDTQSKRAVKELTQRSKRLKTKHGLVVVAPIHQIARTLKESSYPRPRGDSSGDWNPRTSRRFSIQSSNPSWKVLVALGH